MNSLALATVGFLCMALSVLGSEGQRVDAVLLNGQWEFAVGTGEESAPDQARLPWKAVTLPGQFLEWSNENATGIRFLWVRRDFAVTPEQAGRLAVLRWNRIALCCTAFLNGQKVGESQRTGPYQVIVPPGVLRAGANDIVLRIAGAAGAPKAKSGHFLFPSGFATCHRRGMPAVTDDVWLDFADRVYMKWLLALPDLAGNRVRIRVTPVGREPLDGLTVRAEVRPWPKGQVAGRGESAARLRPDPDPLGGEHFIVDVPMPGFKPWTHEARNLYVADVSVLEGTRVLDRAQFRFGMREIRVRDGNYQLNGRTLWLRGSNLVFEWDWGDIITGKEKAYLVTEAREMSMNCFRTHTQPPPRLWADVCDEHGTFLLAEFPCLYNYRDYGFTPEEYAVWHRNTLLDAAGWMGRLWNHPSVIMWVLSNESRRDNAWETGPYQDLVNRLDPTRPTMRTGTTGTRDNYDVHTCGNTNHDTHEGQLQTRVQSWFRPAKGRTVTNSEYMNIFRRPITQWTGTDDKEADALAYAQLGMEHTEAMRRARLDAILPYMYAGWTRTRRGAVWRAGYAQPVSACWHSALSPALASLDLFDPSYRVGQDVTTPLYLINDSWRDASIHVDLLLTRKSPDFIPEAPCLDAPLAKWSFDFDVPADSIRHTPVTWRLPDAEGSYWLTARTTGLPGRPVLSQRFVRALGPPPKRKAATVALLGKDGAADRFFQAHGVTVSGAPADLAPDRHVVLVWDAGRLTPEEKALAGRLRNFAAKGGLVAVLSTRKWAWPALCDLEVSGAGGSRAFPHKGAAHPMLDGIAPQWLQRWNGLPGTVAVAGIAGPAVQAGKPILWLREPKNTVVAEVAAGQGRILFSQLDIRRHVDPASRRFDPVAERILLNLVRPGETK
ncbi:hypothetical protein HQ560_01895 [bacterium]|nr:hypothetical protein [bacterium]